jgi:hypothetical protein
MSRPNFELLRAERNRKHEEFMQEMRDQGWDASSFCVHNDPNRCYCACGSNPPGPCEHTWDGPAVEFDSGVSATCSRCGLSAMSHDLRVMP